MAKKECPVFSPIHLSHDEITSTLNRQYQENQVRKSIKGWGKNTTVIYRWI